MKKKMNQKYEKVIKDNNIESEFEILMEEDEKQETYDINEDFRQDPRKFLGSFRHKKEKYIITKKYIKGEGDQIQLYYSRLTPKESVKCSVGLVHGFAEHSGRYLHVAEQLVLQGVEVHLVDLRGFGYSGGPRASCHIHHLHQDIYTLLQQVNQALPLFLIGFSMGGMLVSSFLLNNP